MQSIRPQASRRLDFIIIGLLVVAVGLFVVDRWILDKDDVATLAAADGDVPGSIRNSIAVLPFVNISADAEQQFLADGLTEELLNRLARIPSLKVPARTSSFYYKDKKPELREVGTALGVGTVLEAFASPATRCESPRS